MVVAVKERHMSCPQQHESMDFQWTWAERKTESYSSVWALCRTRGKDYSSQAGNEMCVCSFDVTGQQRHLCGGSQPEEVSLGSWWVDLGSLGQSLCQAEAGRITRCKGTEPGVRCWKEMFKHFFLFKLFRVAFVVWSQRVISGVNCLHGQENQFAIIL